MPYLTAAIPQYTTGVTAIRQYNYSDSDIVEIECPFSLGRLSSLYIFEWERVLSSGLGVRLRTNGTLGVYWLAEEYNRTLHVNISAVSDRRFRCVGAVQTCSGTRPCRPVLRLSPNVTIMNTIGKHNKFVYESQVDEFNYTLGMLYIIALNCKNMLAVIIIIDNFFQI